jgi:hypothetical protein
MTCLLLYLAESGQAQPNTYSVGFTNTSHTSVIVKGYTIVNQTKKPGQLLAIQKGGKAFEVDVPTGVRYYTVYDAITNRVLLPEYPVPIQNTTVLSIRTSPLDPTKVVITK